MPRALKGTVRERRPGYWEVRVKGISRSVSGTEADADQLLRDLLSALHREEPLESDDTLNKLLDDWIDVQEMRRLQRTTLGRYRRDADRYIRPTLGTKMVRKITRTDIQRLYAALGKRLSPSSVRGVHAVLRAALQQAVDNEELRKNPAVGVKLPEMDPPEIRPVLVTEALALVRAAEETNAEFASYISLAAIMSLRRGELCGLQWPDVDWETGILHVRRSIAEPSSGGWYEKLPKTNRKRKVPLDPRAEAVLRLHQERMTARSEAARTPLVPDAFVFSPEPDGSHPYRPHSMTNAFSLLRDGLGLRHVHLHSLRHFAPTHLLPKGADARAMAQRLGHSSQLTTLAIYTDYLEASGRDLAVMAGELLFPDAKKGAPSLSVGENDGAPEHLLSIRSDPTPGGVTVSSRPAWRTARGRG